MLFQDFLNVVSSVENIKVIRISKTFHLNGVIGQEEYVVDVIDFWRYLDLTVLEINLKFRTIKLVEN